MQVPPPVFSQVPPPPAKKPIKWPLVIALSMIVVGCVGFVALMAAGTALGWIPDKPPERKGFGHPVMVRQSKDGFGALYDFPEVPMKIELPAKPEPFRDIDWESEAISGISGWIGYRWQSDIALYSLVGIWHRDPETIDLGELIEAVKDDYEKESDYKRFVSNTSKTKIGAFEGRMLVATYRYHGLDYALRLFLWMEKDRVFYLTMYTLDKNQEYGVLEQDTILNSIEFR